MDAEENRVPKQAFDRWLDTALKARVEAEPGTSLEERVLARLATSPPHRRVVWWPVFAAVAALLMISVGMLFMRSNRPSPNVVSQPTQRQRPSNFYHPSVVQARKVPRHGEQHGTRHARAKGSHCCTVLASHVEKSESLPKLSVFPTPRPETEQEHLLFRLAAQRGSFETASLNSELPMQELSVPEIKIAPMEGTPPNDSPQH
jgi:hypothetical protein